MTLDELQQRDRRIADLVAKGRGRDRREDHELGTLVAARDQHWRRLPETIARARAKAEHLEFYARQVGFTFDERTTA